MRSSLVAAALEVRPPSPWERPASGCWSWKRRRCRATKRAAAGDAAGLVDPLTGEGIRFALGVRNSLATYTFVDLFSRRITYPQVIRRLFGSLPLFFFTEAAAALAGLLAGPERRQGLRHLVYGRRLRLHSGAR